MNRIHRSATASALALALALPITATGTAFAAPTPATATPSPTPDTYDSQLELPRPTGPHAVGRSTLHLVDEDRLDPWVPQAGARELMVSMYYPARPGTGRAAPYTTAEEARLLLKGRGLDGQIPAETISGTRTNAHADARPAHGRFPLVVLSPGFSMPRTTLTSLAEDLASRGYVVATVDHAYESFGTAFPGGRMLTCVACEKTGPTVAAQTVEGRAKDVSFLIDELTGRHSPWRHSRLIDPKRIGMAGHSIGGASAALTMTDDRRVRAGVNLDGSFAVPLPASGLDGRPFMLFGTESSSKDTTWNRGWARLDGWKRWLTVTGSEHFTFTDFPVLAEQLSLADPSAPLTGQRSAQITRDYVGAFFDLHLRGLAQPLLDGPTSANPEVRLQRP